MKKITKALFPVAGMGTRMLPASKSIPKELLPLYDTPILDILLEECIDAGITEFVVVTSKGKDSIMDYVDNFPELEKKLQKKADAGDTESKKRLAQITKFTNVNFSFVRQGEQNGDGHAILCAEHLLKNDDFLVVFGDEITFGEPSSITQLLEAYAEKNSSIIGVQEVPQEKISAYGVVNPSEQNFSGKKVQEITGVVEKPKAENAPSNLAVIGKYICTSDIWDALKNSGVSEGGETRLIDGFEELLKTKKISSCTIDGKRFDTGSMHGYFFAMVFSALKSKEITKEELQTFIENL
jgi:UTP--glucose-1-phosphate uridylyltransferase